MEDISLFLGSKALIRVLSVGKEAVGKPRLWAGLHQISSNSGCFGTVWCGVSLIFFFSAVPCVGVGRCVCVCNIFTGTCMPRKLVFLFYPLWSQWHSLTYDVKIVSGFWCSRTRSLYFGFWGLFFFSNMYHMLVGFYSAVSQMLPYMCHIFKSEWSKGWFFNTAKKYCPPNTFSFCHTQFSDY